MNLSGLDALPGGKIFLAVLGSKPQGLMRVGQALCQ